jgi:hypothetical protein
MKPSLDTDRIDLLILARLAGGGTKKPNQSDLKKYLTRFVEHVLTPGEWQRLLDKRLAALRERKDLDADAPLTVTEQGRARLLKALGVDSLPPWQAIYSQVLTAWALNLPPTSGKVRERLKTADGLRGSILRQQHGLQTKEAPTLNQAIDALVWRALGVETDQPLSLNKLRLHTLKKRLGDEMRLSLDKLKALLAAEAVNSASTDANALRRALARRWLAAQEMSVARPPEQRPGPSAVERPQPFNLETFARRVKEAARTERGAGRFGDRKVFISAVWRTLRDDPLCVGMKPDEFKAQLVNAHRAGLLILHRADLIGAMDAKEVQASETRYLNATFHFIESEL